MVRSAQTPVTTVEDAGVLSVDLDAWDPVMLVILVLQIMTVRVVSIIQLNMNTYLFTDIPCVSSKVNKNYDN